MTVLVHCGGLVYGKAPITLGTATTGPVLTSFIKTTSALLYLRGTNGTNTTGGAGRPYMSALIANTSFTVSNQGGGATSASWSYMP